MRRLAASIAVSVVLLGSASAADDALYLRAVKKIEYIEERKAPPGSVIVFTQNEINAWAKVRIPEIVPDGVRGQHLQLKNGGAEGFALMDFLKMRHAKGEATNWVFAKLIEGERPVEAEITLQTKGGYATVELKRLTISGIPTPTVVLDFLIKTFLLSMYPTAHIGEPFEMGHNLDHLELKPGGVRVFIKKQGWEPLPPEERLPTPPAPKAP
ncbi:MAG: hypothetical protein ABI823_11995 [Bryobacteraceae bacterium]